MNKISNSNKILISSSAYDKLKIILKPSKESPTSSEGELHWNACKRHAMECIDFQFEVA